MKKFILLLTIAFAAMSLSAADVSSTQAKAAASAFLNKQVAAGHIKAAAAAHLQLVRAAVSVATPTSVDYDIFTSAQAYVLDADHDLAPKTL